MIAAVAAEPPSTSLLLDWFDVVVVVVLGFGVFRGRRNGMSKELLPLLQWISLVLVCGLVHPQIGNLFISAFTMDKMWSFILGYGVLMLLIIILFTGLKRAAADRLVKSNYFGSGEYYLGMLSGLIRYACILMVAMAFLNAPFYTQAEIQSTKAYNERWFGGGVYSGNYWPDMPTVQDQVFKKSFIGSYVKNHLEVLLIATASPPPPQPQPKIIIGH